jgi:hypothetical protein
MNILRQFDCDILGLGALLYPDVDQLGAGDLLVSCALSGIHAPCDDELGLGFWVGGKGSQYRNEILVREIEGFATEYSTDSPFGYTGTFCDIQLPEAVSIGDMGQSRAEIAHRFFLPSWLHYTQLTLGAQPTSLQRVARQRQVHSAKRRKNASTISAKNFCALMHAAARWCTSLHNVFLGFPKNFQPTRYKTRN